MSIKDLFVQAPKLCGAYHAENHAKVAQLVWDHEKEKNGFPRVENEGAFERIAFLFDWECEDEDKREYCLNLAILNVLAHYGAEHGDIEAAQQATDLKMELEADEAAYPDVASVLSVSAAAKGWWGE